jgi:hypothetical protein
VGLLRMTQPPSSEGGVTPTNQDVDPEETLLGFQTNAVK